MSEETIKTLEIQIQQYDEEIERMDLLIQESKRRLAEEKRTNGILIFIAIVITVFNAIATVLLVLLKFV